MGIIWGSILGLFEGILIQGLYGSSLEECHLQFFLRNFGSSGLWDYGLRIRVRGPPITLQLDGPCVGIKWFTMLPGRQATAAPGKSSFVISDIILPCPSTLQAVHPLQANMETNLAHFRGTIVFVGPLLGFHVSFQECTL